MSAPARHTRHQHMVALQSLVACGVTAENLHSRGCRVTAVTWPHAVQTKEQAHSELVGNCLLVLLGGIGVRAHPVLASCSGQDPPAAAKAAGVAQAKVNPCRSGSTL